MKTNFFLFLIFTFLIFACKKEEIINNGNSPTQNICVEQLILHGEELNWEVKSDSLPPCYEFIMMTPNEVYIDGYRLGEVTVCPLPNSNKFAYLRQGVNESGPIFSLKQDLYVYDMCSGTSNKIADNVIYSIHWGMQDWIIFTGVDYQLYKIRPNGSELTQLTHSEYPMINVRWSPDGTKYFYDAIDSKIISDVNGEIIDSFQIYMSTWDWLNDDEIIYYSGHGLYILNINDGTTEIIQGTADVNIDYFKVVNEDEIYIRNNEGLHRLTNLTAFQLIYPSYFSYHSFYLDNLSADYLIINRGYYNFEGFDDCEYRLHHRLTVLDKNTGKEWLINIE